jgi:hypothetical protein
MVARIAPESTPFRNFFVTLKFGHAARGFAWGARGFSANAQFTRQPALLFRTSPAAFETGGQPPYIRGEATFEGR